MPPSLNRTTSSSQYQHLLFGLVAVKKLPVSIRSKSGTVSRICELISIRFRGTSCCLVNWTALVYKYSRFVEIRAEARIIDGYVDLVGPSPMLTHLFSALGDSCSSEDERERWEDGSFGALLVGRWSVTEQALHCTTGVAWLAWSLCSALLQKPCATDVVAVDAGVRRAGAVAVAAAAVAARRFR